MPSLYLEENCSNDLENSRLVHVSLFSKDYVHNYLQFGNLKILGIFLCLVLLKETKFDTWFKKKNFFFYLHFVQ
jgi:hypothetical protein